MNNPINHNIVTADSLTDEQKEKFVDEFYDFNRDDTPEDKASPLPWGCPWLFGFTVKLKGETISEMVDNYIDIHSSEWE